MLPVVTDKPNVQTLAVKSEKSELTPLPAQKKSDNSSRLRKLLREGASREGVKFERLAQSHAESHCHGGSATATQRANAAIAALGRDSKRFAELLQQLKEEHEVVLAGVVQDNLRLVEDMKRLKELLEAARAPEAPRPIEAVAEKDGVAASEELVGKKVSADDVLKSCASDSSLALKVEEKRQAFQISIAQHEDEVEDRSHLPAIHQTVHTMPEGVSSKRGSLTSLVSADVGAPVGRIESIQSHFIFACGSEAPSRRTSGLCQKTRFEETPEFLSSPSDLDETRKLLHLNCPAEQESFGTSQEEDMASATSASSILRIPTSAAKRQNSNTDEFVLLDVWLKPREVKPASRLARSHGSRSDSSHKVGSRGSRMSLGQCDDGEAMIHWSDRFITRPCSGKRVCWDVLGCFLICYDLVIIPLQTFKIKETAFTSSMLMIASIFWTLDIAFTFLTGFNSDGHVITHPVRIAKRYAKTWFCFDMSLIIIDWSLCFAKAFDVSISGATGDTAASIMVTLGRCLRIVRLLKLLKIYNGTLSDLLEHVQSELFVISLNMGKLVIMILLLNHVIACFWYSIGSWDATKEDSWVSVNRLYERSFQYKYFTALHWSLTQFTPASMEVVPQNEGERMYTICVMVFAMVTFSSFISSITNAMTQLRSINKEKLHTEAQLRRYLGENKVSVALMGRVWGCLSKAWRRQKNRVHWKDLEVLPMLPSGLKSDVQDEVYGHVLAVHPFFLLIIEMYPEQSRRLYQQGLDEYSVAVGHEVFSFSDQAAEMYWTLDGTLSYTKEEQGSVVHVPPSLVQSGIWLCEPVLWVKWKHVGQLVASSRAELVTLRASSLQEALADNIYSRKYALKFWNYFKDHVEGVTDLFVDDELIEELVIDASSEAEDSMSASDFVGNHISHRQSDNSHQGGIFSALSLGRRTSFAFGLGANAAAPMSSVRRKSMNARKSLQQKRDSDLNRSQSVLEKLRATQHQHSTKSRQSSKPLQFGSFLPRASGVRMSNLLNFGKSKSRGSNGGKTVGFAEISEGDETPFYGSARSSTESGENRCPSSARNSTECCDNRKTPAFSAAIVEE